MRCRRMFDERSESTGMNHTSAESLNHSRENAKNWFWIGQTTSEKFACFSSKIWWIFTAKFHFFKTDYIFRQRAWSLEKPFKSESKTFDFTGENDKFNQGNKERGMTDSLHGMTGLKDLRLAQE